MNLLTKLAILITFSTLAFSEVTMCFKQNHNDMTTIESTKLDGGLCSGDKSATDMKKEGWKIDDMKISSNNYFYIFKKVELSLDNVDMDQLEARVLAKMENKRKEEKEKSIKQAKIQLSIAGEHIYINKCKGCHGKVGEEVPGNTVALNKISFERFDTAMNGYRRGSYNLGSIAEMRDFAMGLNGTDSKNIYIYLQSLKAKKTVTEDKDTVSK